jgi:hypothetical protein
MARIKAVTIRVPESWCRQVDSRRVRQMLAGWFRDEQPLPADPGPGEAYLRLSIPERPLRVFVATVGGDQSVALRRLIAANLPLPAGRPRARIPAGQVAPKAIPRVEILGKPALPPAMPAAGVPTWDYTRSAPAWCPGCGAWTEHAYFGSDWLCTVCEGANRAGGRQAEVPRYEAFWKPASGEFWERYGLLIVGAGIVAALVFGRPGLFVVIGSAVGGFLGGFDGAVLGAEIAGMLVLLRKLGGDSKGALLKAQVIPVSEGFALWVPKP